MTKTEILALAQHCDQPLAEPWLNALVDKYADKPYYYRFLYKLGQTFVEAYKNPIYVELGVLYGDSALHFMTGAQADVAYGVDRTYQLSATMRDEEDFIFIKGDSRDQRVANMFADASIDVLFIDTHHKYEVMQAELAIWLPKLKPDGLVLADDVCSPQESCSILWQELPYDKLTLPELHPPEWGFGVLFPPFTPQAPA